MSLKKLYIIFSCLVATSAFAQQYVRKVQIETIPVAKGVFMLVGSGGKIDYITYSCYLKMWSIEDPIIKSKHGSVLLI